MFLVNVILSSIFQFNYLSEIWTVLMKGLKFKTREIATTTSPIYTRRHREHFNVPMQGQGDINCKDVKPRGLGSKNFPFFEYLEASKSSKRIYMLYTQFTRSLLIRSFFRTQKQSCMVVLHPHCSRCISPRGP